MIKYEYQVHVIDTFSVSAPEGVEFVDGECEKDLLRQTLLGIVSEHTNKIGKTAAFNIKIRDTRFKHWDELGACSLINIILDTPRIEKDGHRGA